MFVLFFYHSQCVHGQVVAERCSLTSHWPPRLLVLCAPALSVRGPTICLRSGHEEKPDLAGTLLLRGDWSPGSLAETVLTAVPPQTGIACPSRTGLLGSASVSRVSKHKSRMSFVAL